MDNFKSVLVIVLPLLIVVGGAIIYTSFRNRQNISDTSSPSNSTVYNQPINQNTSNIPPKIIKDNTTYRVKLKTTEGDITLELSKETPVTTNNFVYLSQQGFYNNTIFHRVIKGFMIQGGDPQGNGTGGPGYKFDDEPFSGEYTKGTIAMANSGPNTNGSQFFIMHANYPLPKNYVIFGKTIEGIEVVDKIASKEVTNSSMGELSKPIDPTRILSIEIEEVN